MTAITARESGSTIVHRVRRSPAPSMRALSVSSGETPAYDLVNGRPDRLSPYPGSELRTWTEQELLVCAGAGAPSNLAGPQAYVDSREEAVAAALRAGVDSFTDHGTDASVVLGRLRRALERGLIGQEDVDRVVRRQLLTARFLLGEFDPALVLPRNEPMGDGAPLLPLTPGTADARLAVAGLLADTVEPGWYSGALPHRSSPLDGIRGRFGADRVDFAEGVDRIRLRTADGRALRVPEPTGGESVRGPEAALDPALPAGRTDLPPLTAGTEGGSVLDLIDWGDGVPTLRALGGRCLSVAEDGRVRASADEPGGWVVRETFRFEAHGDGHLLLRLGTGGYVSVAADGVKVAADRETAETFTVETVESGEEAVARAAAGAGTVIVAAGNDPHIDGRETEDRADPCVRRPPGPPVAGRARHSSSPPPTRTRYRTRPPRSRPCCGPRTAAPRSSPSATA